MRASKGTLMSPVSELPIALRKARAGISLLVRFLRRGRTRISNLLRKKWRHYSKRAAWYWKWMRERVRNGRTTVVNFAGAGLRRLRVLHKPFVRLFRRSRRINELLTLRRQEWHVERQIRRVVRSDVPLVLGPWLSEVGFEVLYWLPFLRWLKTEYGWDPASAVAISRGGVASWYHGLADHYVEIFEYVDLHTFVRRNSIRRDAADGSQKQLHSSDFDHELIQFACERAGFSRHRVVHPSAMYKLFRQFWLGHRPISHVQERTRFADLTPCSTFDLSGLPKDYVAVKLYTAQSLPDSTRNRRVLHALIEQLSEVASIVILDTGIAVDDHTDYGFDRHDRVFHLGEMMRPQNNLELQTQVIAGAKEFVGTCGSLAWLAPMIGVPTVALFSDARFLRTHLYFARHAYSAMGAARFATLDVSAHEGLGFETVMQVMPTGVQ